MNYEVRIKREIVYETTVTVEAENPDMAADEAYGKASATPDAFPWKKSDDEREYFSAKRDDVKVLA